MPYLIPSSTSCSPNSKILVTYNDALIICSSTVTYQAFLFNLPEL